MFKNPLKKKKLAVERSGKVQILHGEIVFKSCAPSSPQPPISCGTLGK